MSEWMDIETAPKNGTPIMAKRVYQGRLVAEGVAVWGDLHDAAPSRTPLGIDPLGRLSAADYQREAAATAEWSSTAKWLREDRMYAFPAPTHWKRIPAPVPNGLPKEMI